jgi:hypothetical protein
MNSLIKTIRQRLGIAGMICVSLVITTAYSSCTNRYIYLIPEGPLAFIEDSVIFSIYYNENYPRILYSEPDNHGNRDTISEQILVETNETITDTVLSSFQLRIPDLDADLQMNNINKEFWFYDNQDMKVNKTYKYYGYVVAGGINQNDLWERLSKNSAQKDTHGRLSRVRNVSITVKIDYKVNNMQKEAILTWDYKIKRKLSNKWLDAAMGI